MQPDVLAGIIARAVETATAPLHARIAALEGLKAVTPRDGRDGKDGPPGPPGPAGDAGRDGVNGRDAKELDPVVLDLSIKAIVGESVDRLFHERVLPAVREAVAAIPLPKDGRDGKDGTSVDVVALEVALAAHLGESVDRMFEDRVLPAMRSAIAAIPPPRDGVDGKDGAPGLNGKDGAPGLDGKDGAPGKDGVNGQDGLPGRDGKDGANGLDGKDGAPGRDGANGLDGKDGAPGRDGRDGTQGLPGLPGERGADGVNGRDGKDGLDGLGIEDFDLEFDEARSVVVATWSNGERTKRKDLPWIVYKGVFTAGETYPKGATVTWDGSVWCALKATSAHPGEGMADWQLQCRRGKQGRQGERGKDGAPGRDLTQMDHTGKKW